MIWEFDDGDVKVALGDVRERILEMPDESVHMIVTSPPFFGLRDYGTGKWEGGDDPDCDHRMPPAGGEKSGKMVGTGKRNPSMDGQYPIICERCHAKRVDKQIGLEETPEEWVENLVGVFRECRRVLRSDGSLWLECGDSYSDRANKRSDGESFRQDRADVVPGKKNTIQEGRKAKDLIGAPWMLAFALRADGWYLRRDNIWYKPNPMPESARDRMTTAHSYVFHLTKSATYFHDPDAVREPVDPESMARYLRGSRYDDPLVRETVPYAAARPRGAKRRTVRPGVDTNGGGQGEGEMGWDLLIGANARSVWRIPTEPTPFAHFATFPQDLVQKCIAAGSSERGACSVCGAPWRRIVEASGGLIGEGFHDHEDDMGEGAGQRSDGQVEYASYRREGKGWEPSCACGGVEGMPDAYEVIASPTGEAAGPDPSLQVGRAGMARPRGESEGTRPITRYEQRAYAKQLRSSPHVDAMAVEAGKEAFGHYVRTDRAGARPVPEALLEEWLERGWLERVEVPERDLPPVVPCTVLDPFMGSGTTGLVARRMGRRAVGFELSEEYLEVARNRLSQLALPFAP